MSKIDLTMTLVRKAKLAYAMYMDDTADKSYHTGKFQALREIAVNIGMMREFDKHLQKYAKQWY